MACQRRSRPALGAAAGGIALDQEQLRLLGVARLAVGQLARQAAAGERALAPRQFAGLARGFARLRGGVGLAADGLRGLGVGLADFLEFLAEQAVDQALDFGVAEAELVLRIVLRVGDLDRDDRGQALAQVLAGDRACPCPSVPGRGRTC